MLRRAAAPVVVLLATACASMATPPGGKELKTPVQLLDVSPDSGAVNFTGRAVQFTWDRVVSDRGTGEAALERLIIISPVDGDPRVNWGRERVAVRPRRGWQPNTTYSVTLSPGIADLRGNVDSMPHVIVFSTGPAIATGTVQGNAFDWVGQRGIPRAWMQAIRVAPGSRDSITYVARADAYGAFTIGPLEPGEYLVRGFDDQNKNRGLDRGEMWDSVRVTVAAAPVAVELLAVLRDTIPPTIESVNITDSLHLAVKFDRPLDPAMTIGPGTIRVVRADSTPVPVTSVALKRDADAAKQRGDSARAAGAAPPIAPPTANPPTPRTARDSAAAKARPRPSRPAPETELAVTLGVPLEPATNYRVTAVEVRNILGHAASPTRILQVPKAKPPADSTAAKPAAGDSAAVKPPVRADTTARRDTVRAVPVPPPAARR